ncbi:MAG: carboxymuconolactone decarboxylase family protein [Acidimicrobiales bacterium]
MSEPSAYDRGAEMLREVYAGDVTALPEGAMAFNDVMVKTLFAEIWTRDEMSVRDRRLLIMGVAAANGATDIFKLQAKAALKNGELTETELRETLVTLAPYAGYPNVAPMIGEVERVIYECANPPESESETE